MITYNDKWRPKCPYLSCIGVNYIQCELHCRFKNEKVFNNSIDTHRFTDSVCFREFDTCIAYQEIYAEEISSVDKWILDYRKCAFCCNSSGYTGLKYHHGSTHCYCQKHDVEVENFNSNTVCEWFNKKAGTAINDIFQMILVLAEAQSIVLIFSTFGKGINHMDMFDILTEFAKGDNANTYSCRLLDVISVEPICKVDCLSCTLMCDAVDRDNLIRLAVENGVGVSKVPQLSRMTLEKLNPGETYLKGPRKPLLERRNMTKKGLRFKEHFYNADHLKNYWKDDLYIRASGKDGEIEVFTIDKKYIGVAKLVE